MQPKPTMEQQSAQPTTAQRHDFDWTLEERDKEDFELIEFGIESNDGHLSMKREPRSAQ